MLSTFYDPCPLKLRKLDPQAVEKLKVKVLVNSPIEIAAKGTALQKQMKDFTHICFFYRQQYIYFCSPTKSMFNEYNSVSSQFIKHRRQYRQQSVSRSHVSEKYNLVSLSQLNTVNNTDTVIDLNLNTNHLIDQPFSMDQQGIVSATGTFFNGIVERELSHLQNFFDQYILPELTYPRLKFGVRYDLKLTHSPLNRL